MFGPKSPIWTPSASATVSAWLDTFDDSSGFSAASSDLEHIALTGNHLVQHGIDEESDEETGDEAGYDDYRERPLSIRSDSRGKCGRQQTQAGNERRHHDRTEPQQRRFPRGAADSHSLLPQLVDVRNQNDRCLHRNPE